jgi:lipid II:glycine glycyltransferase (peptidoglycan interpeptide bridge formation enzyme)
VEKHSGSKLFPLVFFDTDDDKPFAAIPLFHMNKFGIKMVFSPPPGSIIHLGPIFADKGYKQHKFELAYLDFQTNVDEFIKKIGSNYTSIITSTGFLDVRPFIWAGYNVKPSYDYILDLSQGEEAIWSNMSKYLKKNIKGAQKKGVNIVESSDGDSLCYLFGSLERRYAHQHIKHSIKQEYLQDLFRQFKQSNIKMYLAIYDEKPVGALLCTIYKDTVSAWVGGIRYESNDLESNELLHWEVISKAIHDGFKWFEIVGADTRHLCDFKAKFCPEISICFSIKKANLLGTLAEKAYMFNKKGIFRHDQ